MFFVPITKVDANKREVWGRLTAEVPDKSGEIFDYETSKPYFEKWSAEVLRDSGGKSLGNLRAMHGNVAAGKIIAMNFDDVEKAIDIGSKVVDDKEWAKVEEGVYTGYSVGGKYVKKWDDAIIKTDDGKALKRFTANPNEASLVDRPCVPTATFQMIKADGVTETREFKKVEAREDVNPEEGKKKYGDVKFADEKNKKYPIDTEAHIRAAWNYINKEKNASKYSAEDLKTIKGKIDAAWKEKINPDGPPSAEAAKAEFTENMKKVIGEANAAVKLGKGMYAVAQLASIINDLANLQDACEWEAGYEGDDSLVPEQLDAHIKELSATLKDMVAEETAELTAECCPACGKCPCCCETTTMAMAAKAGDLAKAGARNSKADMEHVQAIHDHAAGLGADCKGAEKAAADGDLQKLEKVAAANAAMLEELRKALDIPESDSTGAFVLKLHADFQKIQTENADIKKRVTELEAKPAEPKGKLKSIEKGQDIGTDGKTGKEEEKLDGIKKEGGMADAVREMKKVHQLGPVPLIKL